MDGLGFPFQAVTQLRMSASRPSSSFTADRTDVRSISAIPPARSAVKLRRQVVDVVAGATCAAKTAGHQGVQDHLVARRDRADSVAHLKHGSGGLMTNHIGQLNAALGPLPLDNVQVRATNAGSVDLGDEIQWPGDLRLENLVEAGKLAVLVDPDGLHEARILDGIRKNVKKRLLVDRRTWLFYTRMSTLDNSSRQVQTCPPRTVPEVQTLLLSVDK